MLEDTLTVHDCYGGAIRLTRYVGADPCYRAEIDADYPDGPALDADALDALAAAAHAAADRLRLEGLA